MLFTILQNKRKFAKTVTAGSAIGNASNEPSVIKMMYKFLKGRHLSNFYFDDYQLKTDSGTKNQEQVRDSLGV